MRLKKPAKMFLISVLAFATIFIFCRLAFSEVGYYQGPISDHFDGKRFFNPSDSSPHEKSVFAYFKSKFFYEKEHGKPVWSRAETAITTAIPKAIIDNNSIVATYVGHSTFLLQLEGANILTDPVWSKRASPVSFAGPKRVKNPGIKFEDLPKIDLVLISHSHYDHMDLPTIKLLKNHSNPKFLVGLGNCHYLNQVKSLNLDCQEMDWGDKFNFNEKLVINFLPAKHWSKRAFFGSNVTLWGAFAIESRVGPVYFAGDTGYGEHFKEAAENFGNFTLALLPIGAYKPKDFMSKNHIGPTQAVQAHLELMAKKSIAMHYETFQMASDNFSDPRSDLEIAKKEHDLKDDFVLLPVAASLVVKK